MTLILVKYWGQYNALMDLFSEAKPIPESLAQYGTFDMDEKLVKMPLDTSLGAKWPAGGTWRRGPISLQENGSWWLPAIPLAF